MVYKHPQIPLKFKSNLVFISQDPNPPVHQQQTNTNYINKEPFNEDLEIEECNFVDDFKWKDLVIDKLKEVIAEIKLLGQDPTQV